MVFVQKWPFYKLFFWAIQARKMSFTIFFIQKTPLQPTKKISQSRETDMFPKGLTHSFGTKLAIFPTFFFYAIQARKISFRRFQNETTLFQAKKTRNSKSQKNDIFPKGLTHGFGLKMAVFSKLFFLGNIGQENVFYEILERKNAFLGYKNKKLKKSKKLTFFQRG